MNPFTTEHPLASVSWFGGRKHPTLSFFCRSIVLALIFTPFVLVRLYYYAISDIGVEPNPFPQPWWAVFWGSVIAFVLGLVFAVSIMFLWRLFARRSTRDLTPTKQPCGNR